MTTNNAGVSFTVVTHDIVGGKAGVDLIILGASAAMQGRYDIAAEVLSGNAPAANLRDNLTVSAVSATRGPMQYKGTFKLGPGAYTLNVAMKDPAGATPGATLNFNVH